MVVMGVFVGPSAEMGSPVWVECRLSIVGELMINTLSRHVDSKQPFSSMVSL